MALSWHTLRALPRLFSYEAAKKYALETKPIRGDADGIVPLGRRDQKYRCIRYDPPTGNVEVGYSWNLYRDRSRLKHYRTFLVYYPDNTIEIDGLRLHATEQDVVGRLLPGYPNFYTLNSTCYLVLDGKHIRLNNKTMSKFTLYGERLTPCFVPPDNIIHHVDRKAKREATREFAEFKTYFIGMMKLRGETPGAHELAEVFGIAEGYEERFKNTPRSHLTRCPQPFTHWGASKMYMGALHEQIASGDLNQWYKASLYLATCMNWHQTGWWDFKLGEYVYQPIDIEPRAKGIFTEALWYMLSDRWLVPVKVNRPRYDRYQRFIAWREAV